MFKNEWLCTYIFVNKIGWSQYVTEKKQDTKQPIQYSQFLE